MSKDYDFLLDMFAYNLIEKSKHDSRAKLFYDIFVSFVGTGFTRKESMELLETAMTAALLSGKKE